MRLERRFAWLLSLNLKFFGRLRHRANARARGDTVRRCTSDPQSSCGKASPSAVRGLEVGLGWDASWRATHTQITRRHTLTLTDKQVASLLHESGCGQRWKLALFGLHLPPPPQSRDDIVGTFNGLLVSFPLFTGCEAGTHTG